MAPETLPAETIIGSRFRIKTLLGRGGLGSLYLALDVEADEQIALRILASDLARSEVAIDQLRAQVRSSSKLAHKNVARLFGMGKDGSMRYLACEYVRGHGLRDVIARRRDSAKMFSLKSAYNVIAHACNALRAALQLGFDPPLYHGLPGPGSIRISRAGRVKLCDFGLACALPPGSGAVSRLGDLYGMAPDLKVSPSQATPAADIYTLGVVLYEMLCGQPPTDPYTPLTELVPTLPPDVDRIVLRCLQTDPTLRFPNPEELKAAVYRAIETAPNASDIASPRPVSSQATAAPAETAQLQERAEIAESTSSPLTEARYDSTLDAAQGPADILPSGPPFSATLPSAGLPSPRQRMRVQTGPGMPPPGHPSGFSPPAATFAPAGTRPHSAPQLTPLSTGPMPGPTPATRLEDLLAAPIPDDAEKWLVRQDGLDFGPFTLGDVKQQLFKDELSGTEDLIDQETGRQIGIGRHPALAAFVRLLDVYRQDQAAEQARAKAMARSKRRRAIVVTTVSISLAVLAISGVTFYLLGRNPKVVIREVEVPGQPNEARLKLDVTWKNEPAAQAARRKAMRRKRRRRARKTGGTGRNEENVTYLGDATEAGGDQLLSQQQIQSVMEKNMQKLARCVVQQAGTDPELKTVSIDFGVRGTGKVSYVKVNGEREGPFQACIARSMQGIRFPAYDGSLTRASFAMNIGR